MSGGLFKGGGGGRRPNLEWSRKGVLSAGGIVLPPFTEVDWLHRMNTAALEGATPSVAELDGGTYGLGTGSWSKTGADGFWTQEFDDTPSIPGLGLAGGAGVGGATGNAGFPMSANPGVTFRGATFTWGSAKPTISVGFALFIDNSIDGADAGDLYYSVRLDGGGGNFFIAGLEVDGADTLKMFAHCNSVDGEYTPLMGTDTWYWVTMLWLSGSADVELAVYELAGLGLVGTSTGTKLDGSNSCTGIRCFGRTDNTGQVTINANNHRSTCHCARFANAYPLVPAIL